jgi:hypothetical protein
MSEMTNSNFCFYKPRSAALKQAPSQPPGEQAAAIGAGAMLTFSVLDVEAVPVDTVEGDDCGGAVKTFILDSPPAVRVVDIAIAGGGMGGIAAALAVGVNCSVILTEETSWLGGQMTSQGVSALDENKYVESSGACANYLRMREAIRKSYRDTGKLTDAANQDTILNPGTCWVTRLAFEPLVALPVLEDMVAPLVATETLTILKRTKIVAVALHEDKEEEDAKIKALLAVNLDTGHFLEIHCKTAIDATELGDLLPLAKIPYSTGSDSRWLTGEDFAPEVADPQNVQDYTYPFLLEYHPGQSHVIEKPADFDRFLSEGKFSFDGYKMFEENVGERHLLPFWTYRRLIDKELFAAGTQTSDLAMINWDSNDMRGQNIIDKEPREACHKLSLAKRLSLGFCYWLQTEAPRDDGTGKGYPELKLIYDKLGTKDGLSKYPYIREARRMAARTVVVAQDIVDDRGEAGGKSEAPKPARAKLFEDSCGIGLYPVDIHGHQEIPGAAQQTRPFQIPVSSLVSDYCPNFIAACKNIGVTHITNGAYRLHPIEWAIGTAAGALARLAIKAKKEPAYFIQPDDQLLQLQIALAEMGAPTFWFDDLTASHEGFAAAQVLATKGIIPFNGDNMSFNPDQFVSSQDLEATARALSDKLFGMPEDWSEHLGDIAAEGGAVNRAVFANSLLKMIRKMMPQLAVIVLTFGLVGQSAAFAQAQGQTQSQSAQSRPSSAPRTPANHQHLYLQAQHYEHKGDYAKAAELYQQVLKELEHQKSDHAFYLKVEIAYSRVKAKAGINQ